MLVGGASAAAGPQSELAALQCQLAGALAARGPQSKLGAHLNASSWCFRGSGPPVQIRPPHASWWCFRGLGAPVRGLVCVVLAHQSCGNLGTLGVLYRLHWSALPSPLPLPPLPPPGGAPRGIPWGLATAPLRKPHAARVKLVVYLSLYVELLLEIYFDRGGGGIFLLRCTNFCVCISAL
jgi:hypothetical protein